MSKKALRRKYLARRDKLPPHEAARLSAELCLRITSSKWFTTAGQLLMYMPYRQEVDIRPLMEMAWEQGKTIYLPKSEPKTKSLVIYKVVGVDELQPGVYGILEPVADKRRRGNIRELDLVFVPGAVFDRHGYRIGYGGGYYDRFLPKLRSNTLIAGVAYSFQVVDCLPRERHDQRLDVLVTESDTHWFKT